MMLKSLLFQIIWLTFWGCSFNSDAEANDLYVSASLSMKAAISETGSYTKSFELYSRALVDIEQILSEYKSSKVATSLSSGLITVSGYSLNDFQGLSIPLKTLASAKPDPLSSAVLVANAIGGEDSLFQSSIHVIFGKNKYSIPHLHYARELKSANVKGINFQLRILFWATGEYEISSSKDTIATKIQIDSIARNIQIDLIVAEVAGNGLDSSLAKAFLNAPRIKDPWKRYWTYCDIANSSELNQSLLALSKALESAQLISNAGMRARAIVNIANMYYEHGKAKISLQLLTLASKTAQLIQSAHNRAHVLVDISEELAKTGNFSNAYSVANTIEGAIYEDIALTKIAGVYTKNKQYTLSLDAADRINDITYKNVALAEIAESYIKDKEFTHALEITESLDDLFLKAAMLFIIADRYEDLGLHPSIEDTEILYSIIHTVSPLRVFWE